MICPCGMLAGSCTAGVAADSRYAMVKHDEGMVPVPTDDPGLTLRAALTGFRSARQRFLDKATPGSAPEEVFVPLAEALWWAVSTDDGFERLASSDPGYRPNRGDYQQARNKDQYGQVLCGLRYARDRCGHQLALVAIETGLGFPRTYPITYGEYFRWRWFDQLPPPDRHYPSGRLRPVYDQLLAGHPASRTLEWAAPRFPDT